MPRNCSGSPFQGGKTQYTVYYQKLGTTCGRARRETVNLRQKQGRDSYPEDSVGFLSEEPAREVI